MDDAAKKRRIEELKVEREKIAADMSAVQGTGLLSARRERLVEIDEEIKRLSDDA